MNRALFPLLMLALTFGALAAPAQAELFVDLYAGRAETADATLTFSGPFTLDGEAEFDKDDIYGVRIGGYFDDMKVLGLAVDVSSFEAEAGSLDIDLVPVSLLVMLRVPLFTDTKFPNGLLQPYIAAGPSAAFYEFEVDLRPFLNEEVSDYDVDGGWDIRAGLAVSLSPNLALFGEYRHTRYEIDFSETEGGFLLPLIGVEVDTTLKTDMIQGGLSLRF